MESNINRCKKREVEIALLKKKFPRFGRLAYLFFLLFEYLRFLFRKETIIDLFISIKKQ